VAASLAELPPGFLAMPARFPHFHAKSFDSPVNPKVKD
jgi:hypothetical protein